MSVGRWVQVLFLRTSAATSNPTTVEASSYILMHELNHVGPPAMGASEMFMPHALLLPFQANLTHRDIKLLTIHLAKLLPGEARVVIPLLHAEASVITFASRWCVLYIMASDFYAARTDTAQSLDEAKVVPRATTTPPTSGRHSHCVFAQKVSVHLSHAAFTPPLEGCPHLPCHHDSHTNSNHAYT
jgi:hypothetical protein